MAKNGNKALGDAKKQKKDEFYTQLADINPNFGTASNTSLARSCSVTATTPTNLTSSNTLPLTSTLSRSNASLRPVMPVRPLPGGNWICSRIIPSGRRLSITGMTARKAAILAATVHVSRT